MKETIETMDIKNTTEYLKELAKLKKGEDEVLLGSVINQSLELDVPGVIRLPLTLSPHTLIVGQTRSGKSKSAQSLLTSLSITYPESAGHFYFIDMKGSGEFDKYRPTLSKYDVAKPEHVEDYGSPYSKIDHLVKEIWDEYERRYKLLEELKRLGYECSEYRSMKEVAIKHKLDEKFILPRSFVFIDEITSSIFNDKKTFNKLSEDEGNTCYYLLRLVRESSCLGFSFVFINQSTLGRNMPQLDRCLTTRMYHSLSKKDALYYKVKGLENMKLGEFILNYPGLKCSKTGEKNIQCRLPFVGK